MHAFEAQVVQFLQNLFDAIGWAGVVVAMAIESACIPLPSEVTMPLAGWMLIQAKGLSIWHVFFGGLWGAMGCTIGSIITYWIGALGGRPLVEKYGRYVLISAHDIKRADQWFERWGEETAFFSRLLPVVRTFISLPAGIARMHFAKFTILSFVGSFIWCLLLAGAGFFMGQHWRQVREVMRPFDIPIGIILLALFAWYVWRHASHNRKETTTHEC